VEVVLRCEDIGHPAIALEETDPAYPPVASVGGGFLCVERHVRPVKPAHAEVEDARAERFAVVPRDRKTKRVDRVEIRRAERSHNGTVARLASIASNRCTSPRSAKRTLSSTFPENGGSMLATMRRSSPSWSMTR